MYGGPCLSSQQWEREARGGGVIIGYIMSPRLARAALDAVVRGRMGKERRRIEEKTRMGKNLVTIQIGRWIDSHYGEVEIELIIRGGGRLHES